MPNLFDISQIDWRLYAIIDREYLGDRPITTVAEQLLEGGAGVIQLRNKTSDIKQFFIDAVELSQLTKHYGVPLIINDRADVAIAAGADGVHIGQEDIPLSALKRILNEDKLIGVSVHNVEEFKRVAAEKPDYFGVGTIYKTSTKSHLAATGLDVLKTVRRMTQCPLVAIGGITTENLASVFKSGADGIAVISALLSAKNVKSRTRDFQAKINKIGPGKSL